MANKIQVIQDKSGNNVFPLTHEKAVRDSSGVSLEAKLSALESKTYVEAWDGASTPVIANIPAGVVVSYDGTNYTGTLAASSSTDGKIYLVKDGTEYDRYASTINLGGTYIWSYLGTTAMSLSGYATKGELNQLDQEVSDKTIAPLHVDGNRALIGADGSLSENANINVVVVTFPVKGGTDYAISGRVAGSATGTCLYAWYDADDVFISSGGTSAGEYSNVRVTSPNNAAFIRVSQNRQAAQYPAAAQVIEIADVAKRLEGYDVIEKSLYQPGRIFSYVSRPLDIEITTGKYYTATPAFSPSANYQCAAIKVNAGERLIITAYHLSNSGPGAMLVNSGTGGKQIIIYTGSTAKAICGEIVIPSGYDWLYLNGHTNHPISVVRVERVVRSVLPTDEVQILNYEYQREMIIDARPSSATFGQPIIATNRDWAISQYIDLLDIRHVRLYRNITSTSNSYANIGGLVFYDENLQPLSDGAEALYKGSVAVSNFSDHAVPAGARYLRVSVSINMPTGAIELYPTALNIPMDLTEKFEYEGERISFRHRFAREVYASQGAGAQSAAIWGDYLFFIYDKLSAIHVFNIKSRIRIATITPNVDAGENWHCNQSNFDTRKYDDSDMFPILWTSFQNDGNGRCIWAGLRILTTTDAGGAITSFDVAIVQKIYLPVMTDANCLGNANIAIDQENGFFWAYSYNKNSSAANYREARLTKFAIPALFNGGGTIIPEVYLTDADILDGFFPGYTGDYSQGGFIKRGKLVIAQGLASYSIKPCLRVVDLVAKNVASFVDLNAAGYTEEPQGVFFYDGHVFYTTGAKDQYYRLFFD